MPNYSRSHLGRFIRKMFAAEIERELRMLEEYVLDEEVSDDVGESLMARDEDFEPPEVPFQPKPTSVSIAAIRDSSNDFDGDSNFTTMPKADRPDELPTTNGTGEPAMAAAIGEPGGDDDGIHGANTMILEPGRGRASRVPEPIAPEKTVREQAHPGAMAAARGTPPHPAHRPSPPPHPAADYEDDLHSAPTMIIDIGRMRGRGR
jgi:hypothetical protein